MQSENRKQPLRILQTLSTPQGGAGGVSGPEIRTRNLLPRWDEAGVEVILGYPQNGTLWQEFSDSAKACLPFRLKHRFDAGAIYRAYRLIRRSRADVVHNQGPPPLDFVMALAARMAGVPMILTRPVMNDDLVSHSPRRRALYRRLDACTFRWADAIVAVSEIGRNALIRELPPRTSDSKVRLIYNGVNVERFCPPPTRNTGDLLTIGMIAQLAPTKGWDNFLRIIARLVAKGHRVQALACGDGPERANLEELRETLGLRTVVTFLGLRCDTAEILQQLDVFLFPSHREGLSVAILEAMACGLPIVATDVGATSEQVSDGWNGYLCPPGDTTTMTERTEVLLTTESRRVAMGKRSRERVETQFSESAMFHETLRLYKELGKSCFHGEATLK